MPHPFQKHYNGDAQNVNVMLDNQKEPFTYWLKSVENPPYIRFLAPGMEQPEDRKTFWVFDTTQVQENRIKCVTFCAKCKSSFALGKVRPFRVNLMKLKIDVTSLNCCRKYFSASVVLSWPRANIGYQPQSQSHTVLASNRQSLDYHTHR